MLRKIMTIIVMMAVITLSSQAQEGIRPQPKIWFGFSGAANLNSYTGTTQRLNTELLAPGAFHNGFGAGMYTSLLLEYRPNPVLGFMLNIGYDGKGGKFHTVMAPCNCPADLFSKISYFSVDPSIRIAPFASNFYMFFGAGYSYNIGSNFLYKQELQEDVYSEFSHMQKNSWSTHVGIGYEIPLATKDSPNQVNLSPFIMFKPYFGQDPRSIESWSISTLRVGIAIKFGKTKARKQEPQVYYTPVVTPVVPVAPIVAERDVQFTVQVPAVIPVRRVVKETFPLRNYIFFEKGSKDIPARYNKLSKADALKFDEGQFMEPEPKDVTHRSKRQLTVYSNIINILGYRMRQNPSLEVTLIGASAGDGSALGLSYAESVKDYLVNTFGIGAYRIKTEGRNQPLLPSEQPGGTKYLVQLREGDRRVDVVSNSGNLLAPLQISVVEQDPIDSRIIFKTEDGSKSIIKSWDIDITEETGFVQHYGPFTKSQESISGNKILKDNKKGTFKAVMTGRTKDDNVIRKESTFKLMRNEAVVEEGYRFSILFDFDKPTAVESYDKFLTDVVAPLIKENGRVIIHGHTDIIGSEEYNIYLSTQRAEDVKSILEKALKNLGRNNVKFEVYGFGSDENYSPFENKLPEERFYNRTVIIDIIPN
ncbi:MAG: flagellar motor protein MotB [Bacteroidetes bacterium HGW-Bacteroidetes-8]|nr:MAG: flagellar motor protein MotB [Bacteroidetes bacterium HGW-Bacteroidetes-8]